MGERSSGMAGMLLEGDCELVEIRGYVWLLVTSRGLVFDGVGPLTMRGLSNPAGSSENVFRKMLDEADVGGVSTARDDMELVIDVNDDSLLPGIILLCVEDDVVPESVRCVGVGVGGP